MCAPPPRPPDPDTTRLKALAVRRLLHHCDHGELKPWHLAAVRDAFNVTTRTIRRWMANARQHDGTYTPHGRSHYVLTPHAIDVITRWRGNVTAAHRELRAEPHKDEPPPPSLATFHRAAKRQWNKGQRAGLSGGETARRRYDIHGERDHHHRNYAWETDHVEASVYVIVDGHRRKPHITWFIDCATKCICGVAITPQTPSRESILVALRDAILIEDPHRPYGGIPDRIRVDGGKDFLSETVGQALAALGTEHIVLPPRRPDLKATVEAANGAIKDTLFADMPGYTEAPTLPGGKPIDPDQPLIHFEAFVALVLDWITQRNTEQTFDKLDGKTPHQAWHDDPTPVYTATPEDLHTYTLERPGKPLTINNSGVRWRKRNYIADWMHGLAGEKVHVRYLHHHEHRIELYDPETGHYLGPATLTSQVTPTQRRALDNARRRHAAHLRKELNKAERNRNARYAAATRPSPPQRLDALTEDEATQQLRDLGTPPPQPPQAPAYLPLPQLSDEWALPLGHSSADTEDDQP